MNTSYDKNTAVVILPPISKGKLQDENLKKWLARSDFIAEVQPKELLQLITKELRLPYPKEGLAALRLWGQTGNRPKQYITALDPIYFEPRLDHLCLHALDWAGIPKRQMHLLIDHLQSTIGDKFNFKYTYLSSYAYLFSIKPIRTGLSPAFVYNGQKPDKFLAESIHRGIHQNLLSEIEMSLHGHEVNLTREKNNELPINSMWLWGSGIAPEMSTITQAPLFSNDPLLLGYWNSINADAFKWPGSIFNCLNESTNGFIAEIPDVNDHQNLIEESLIELQKALRDKRLRNLTLLFRDGLRIYISPTHNLRFWRRKSNLIDKLYR